MKWGISSNSLGQALAAGQMTLLDMVEWTKEAGGEHIEIVPSGYKLTDTPGQVQALRRKAEEVGIDISNYTVAANFVQPDEAAWEQEILRVKGEVDVAAELGVKLMRHDVAWRPPGECSIVQFQEDLPKLAEACRRIADYAAQFGITTSVENHGYYMQASERIESLIHAVERSNFRTTMDTGNFICVDESPVKGVRNNIQLASMIHLKDFYIRSRHRNPGAGFFFQTSGGNYLRGAIVGQGDIDIPEILGIIKASGYDGYISIEFEGIEDCRTGVKASLDNVKQIWNDL
ncbi:sugar phosphate isomerase/epimerase family protein [Paenibacillus eucommiae]|uniref:Sugar phosphate isomerase/epimerase n=1 Tax=Paenibacillus eucommiae TaxID=1355755 RepID=A0ABS4IPR9_9BACL|nr:sugar phosphate isomerase/epimerase family protein [Paenibacillus eucommiae]MBP1988619.1 sugar phosphate isomerase/epimerase [Paenibacillus eucommiae]